MAVVRRRHARQEALQRLKAWLEQPEGNPLVIGTLHPADVADVMWLDFEEEEARRIFRALPEEEAAAVLEETELKFQAALLQDAEAALIGRLLGHLPADDAADVLEQLPEQLRLEAMCFVKPEDAADIRHLAAYDPDTAGGMMTTEFLTALASEKVGDLMKRIKRDEGEAETIYAVYVVDPKDMLLGVASTRELLEANIHQAVGEIMNPDVILVKSDEDREEVARRVLHYNLSTIPVVDARGAILGIVTADDALEVLEQEGSEDALLLAGAGGESDVGDTLRTKVLRRAPMLAVPVAAGLLISKIVPIFTGSSGSDEDLFTGEWGLLLSFLPLVLAMSGTVGMQTSAVLVRGIAVGQITPGRRAEVLLNEIRVALLLGMLAALVTGPVIALLLQDVATAAVLALALLLAVSWSGTAAAVIALGSEAAGFDPALVSGPVMMGVSDLSAAALFLGISSVFLL